VRAFLVIVVVTVLLAAVLILAVGWHFSNALLRPQPYALMPEFEILEVGDDTVTLPVPRNSGQFADTRKQGRYGLLWEGGYGRLGEVVSDTGERVVRRLENVTGTPPVAGAPARLDVTLYHRDPLRDHGLSYEELSLQGEAGMLRAWWLEGEGDTAVLMLHGRRRADLTETLRILPTVAELGYPVLALAYRNHDRSDPSPDGFYHYGASEWRDALTGLEFLRRRGIRHVVVYGFSLGGNVAVELYRQLRAQGDDSVQALILDSPFLDVRTVVRQQAREMGLPLAEPLADWTLFVAGLRSRVDFTARDMRRVASEIDVPVLLIHGTADRTIPISLSDAFSSRVSGPIEYRRLNGVEHVEAYNHMPEAYQRWVRQFLQAHASR
jgi:pimeloyl-ACP methyl ester carboxylesterase